jgi:hypothetical protein
LPRNGNGDADLALIVALKNAWPQIKARLAAGEAVVQAVRYKHRIEAAITAYDEAVGE